MELEKFIKNKQKNKLTEILKAMYLFILVLYFRDKSITELEECKKLPDNIRQNYIQQLKELRNSDENTTDEKEKHHFEIVENVIKNIQIIYNNYMYRYKL